MDARQGHQGSQLLQEFSWRQLDAGRAIGPRFCERVHEVSMGIFLETLERYGTSCRVPHQVFQLVTAMRWNLCVGVQREPVDPGAAGPRQGGAFPCIAKAGANPSYLLSGPFPEGEALL